MSVNKKMLGFNVGRTMVGSRRFVAPAANAEGQTQLDALLKFIGLHSAVLSKKVLEAVDLLVEKRRWTAAIRLVVGVAGHQQSDVARHLGVMRSTVARWYNGETQPSDEQMDEYGPRLRELLQSAPAFYLTPDEALVE